MKRTNIVLEEWQYQYLRDRAARERKSLSALIRDLIRAAAAPPGARAGRDPILSIIGLAPGRGGARRHDEVLYRRRAQ
jgi:hypothetical protein